VGVVSYNWGFYFVLFDHCFGHFVVWVGVAFVYVVDCFEVLVVGCLHSFGLHGWIWCSLFAAVFYVSVAWYLVWHICLLDIFDIVSALCGCRLLLLLMGLVLSG